MDHCGPDRHRDALKAFDDISVSESQDANAARRQILRALLVERFLKRVSVGVPIDLHSETGLRTEEVEDKGPKLVLASEF